MNEGFEIITTAEQPVLSMRTVTPVEKLPEAIGKTLAAIAPYMAQMGGQPADAPFVAYYNMDMQNLKVEIGFPVAAPLPATAEIEAGSIPAGPKAVGWHKGSYQSIASTYDAMGAWMKEKGVEPAGVVYEYYYNSPMEVAESELLTKVVFLLK
ncbi:MAG: Bacterial transcription activator, effector binding domain [Firmicutes bacterium ADurb.Bin506]|nr:MAG: Bacterial transcription activator, effector binding domain [Firmicutes bacterium ADurb.Bin506]